MKIYAYIAFDDQGLEHSGVRQSTSRQSLTADLLADGLMLHRVRSPWKRKINQTQAVEPLMARLELLLRANISTVDALELLSQTAPRDCRWLAMSLLERIHSGSRFSIAVAELPDVFDPLGVALLSVGERSGELRTAVNNVRLQLEWQRDLRSRLRRVLLYPLTVTCVLFLVIGFLLVYVVPAFGDLLAGLGRSLPLQTQALLWLSDRIGRIGWGLLLCLGLFSALWFTLTRFTQYRLWMRQRQLGIPVVGTLILQIRLARFSRAMAELTRAGIDLLDAIEISRPVLECEYLELLMAVVHDRVLEGESLSAAILASQSLPIDYGRLLQLGEVSGQLPDMFMQLSDIYDGSSSSQLDVIEATATPCLMVLLAGLLMWIVLAVLGPIYDVLSIAGSF